MSSTIEKNAAPDDTVSETATVNETVAETAASRTDSTSSKIPEGPEQVRLAVAAALDRKAEELVVLHLGEVSDFTEHFLICSGTNERQVQAIADAVVRRLRDSGVRPLHVEGQNQGRWVLLDYGGDLVIHVFLDETREFYDLERLWSDAPKVTARFVAETPEAEAASG